MSLAMAAMLPTAQHLTMERISRTLTRQLVVVQELKVPEVDEGCDRSDVTYHTAPHNE